MMLIDVFCLFKYFDIHKEKILQNKPYYYDKNLLLFVKPFFDRALSEFEIVVMRVHNLSVNLFVVACFTVDFEFTIWSVHTQHFNSTLITDSSIHISCWSLFISFLMPGIGMKSR